MSKLFFATGSKVDCLENSITGHLTEQTISTFSVSFSLKNVVCRYTVQSVQNHIYVVVYVLYSTVLVGSLKMNTTLEYSTRVVQEGDRRCKKSTLNDLAYQTPLRIPLMNPEYVDTLPHKTTPM